MSGISAYAVKSNDGKMQPFKIERPNAPSKDPAMHHNQTIQS